MHGERRARVLVAAGLPRSCNRTNVSSVIESSKKGLPLPRSTMVMCHCRAQWYCSTVKLPTTATERVQVAAHNHLDSMLPQQPPALAVLPTLDNAVGLVHADTCHCQRIPCTRGACRTGSDQSVISAKGTQSTILTNVEQVGPTTYLLNHAQLQITEKITWHSHGDASVR